MSIRSGDRSCMFHAGAVNFLSAFTPAFFCTFSAMAIHHVLPVFPWMSTDILLTFGIFTLPMLFSPIPVHYLTMRFPKRNVVVFSRFFEVLLMLAGTFALNGLSPVKGFSGPGVLPLFGTVLFMGAGYAVFRPALKIYLAQELEKKALPRCSALTESTTCFGISFGGMMALALFTLSSEYSIAFGYAGLLGTVLSAYSMILSSRLPPDPVKTTPLSFRDLPREWLKTLQQQPRYRELVLTGLGESLVYMNLIFTAALSIHYIGTNYKEALFSALDLYLILPSVVTGCAVGCLTGGILCKEEVELGVVPPAAFLLITLELLVGTLPYYSDLYIESGLLMILLAGTGFFSGILLAPVQAYQKYFVKKELRCAFFAWFYLPFGLGILLSIVSAGLIYVYEVEIFTVILILALLWLVLAVFSFTLMSQFLLRMLMKILLMTLYKLRITGKEHIPEEGPALIVANRASFVDLFFISACSSRPIRFLMHESLFRNKFMGQLYKAAGFLEVPENKPSRLRDLIYRTRAFLEAGELICVFPEGEITRNGTMSEFRNGFSFLLPRNREVPVIPLRIGMTWGSIFSCYYGKFKLRYPNELPHPATVTIGKPIPKETSAYELRIILTELAAETEMNPGPLERPFHSQFAFIAKRFPLEKLVWEYTQEKGVSIRNFTLLLHGILLSRKLRKITQDHTRYIGIMLPNSIPAVTALLAIQAADRIPAVLNYTSSVGAMHEAVKKTGLTHIITSRKFVEDLNMAPMKEMIYLEDLLPEVMTLWKKLFWSLPALFLSADELMKLLSPGSWRDVNQCAVVIFSSGSTGIPKGIMLSHHNINGDVSAIINSIGWTRKDRILGNLPLFHSFGMNVCMWLPLTSGCRTALIRNPLDAGAASRALREQQITVAMTTPAFLQTYMRRCKAEDFKSLRLVVSGAEKLRDDIADRFQKMTGLMITEGYGCTELSPIVSLNVANSRLELGVLVAKRGSIGPAVTGVCAKVVDPVTFHLKEENTDGLLIVKGAIVMMGYLGEEAKTAEAIRDGYYITGDIARMDRNGFISLTGRLSRFTKIAGEMIPHELVERTLNKIIKPDDLILSVTGGTDSRKGEKLIVFYTDPEKVKVPELLAKMRADGVPNLWIPKAENFVLVEKIPLLGSGKVDLKALGNMAREFCENRKE